MKKLFALMLLALFSLPMLATEWKDAALADVQCSTKVKANPDAHTRNCAMQCAKSGFGIYTSDGKFLKFDAKGNEQVMDALKKTDKKDHLRVNVTGDQSGDTIKVQSLSLT
ncbi:MAG: hypothetical protein ACXVZV_09915 [Terriglobales bacterium]